MDESLYKTELCEHTYLYVDCILHFILWEVISENLLKAFFYWKVKFMIVAALKYGSKNLIYITVFFLFTFTAALTDFPHFCKDSGFFFL